MSSAQPDLTTLLDDVRSAVAAEFTTIPAYLYAYWSIKPANDGGSYAAQLARESVMVVINEEMLHMALASNLLNALGGTVCLTEQPYLPHYPCRLLRSGNHPDIRSTMVDLLPFDLALPMMLAIELPEWDVRPGQPTLGEFYDDHILGNLPPEPAWYTGGRQLAPWDDPGPGILFQIDSYERATEAIHEIVAQGEGLDARHHDDGDHELAHYWRFSAIEDAVKSGAFDPARDVYPMVASPTDHVKYYSVEQRRANDRFNAAYSRMLDALEDTLTSEHPDVYPVAAGRMRSLQLLAEELRRTGPIPRSGRLPGPTFEYVPA